jgi:hypothetical protein
MGDRPRPPARTPLDYFVRVVILVNFEMDVAIDFCSLTGNAGGFNGTLEAITASFRYSLRSFASGWL